MKNSLTRTHKPAILFSILKNPQTNILGQVSEAIFKDARKGIIKCILATDMAKHGEILNQFKKIVDTFNYDDAEHKSLVKKKGGGGGG